MAKNDINSDSWPNLFKTFNRLHLKMQAELKARGLPALETYDILWCLEQAPKHRLRANEIANSIYLNPYNVTRMLQRLELEELIKKTTCPSDRRGVYAELTKKGLLVRKNIWAVYRELITELYSKKLTQSEHLEIIRIMKKLEVAP